MTVQQGQQGRDDSRSDASAANLFDGGALGLMDRVGDAMNQRFNEMYSAENLHKVMDKVLDNLPPEIREGLSQLFNALSGALSGDEPAQNREYETIKEVYGTGGTTSDNVRMDSNFAQRDDAQFAAAVTIGNGSGAITEVNGIQYVDGKPANDSEDDDIEALQEMGEQMERSRKWAEESHRFGDVEMTGDEWEELSEQLSGNTPLRKRMIDRLMAQGKTQKQAEETVDKAAEVSHVMSVPESQRTPDQQKVLTDASRNKDVNNVISWSAKAENRSVSREVNEDATVGNQAASTQQGADVFASAPDLTSHYAQAVLATEPLDAKPQQIAASSASPKAAIPSMGGLDV